MKPKRLPPEATSQAPAHHHLCHGPGRQQNTPRKVLGGAQFSDSWRAPVRWGEEVQPRRATATVSASMAIRVGSRQERRCRPPTRLPAHPHMPSGQYASVHVHVHTAGASRPHPTSQHRSTAAWFVLLVCVGLGPGCRSTNWFWCWPHYFVCVAKSARYTPPSRVPCIFSFFLLHHVLFSARAHAVTHFSSRMSRFRAVLSSSDPTLLPNPARTRAPPSSDHLPFYPFLLCSTEYKYHSHYLIYNLFDFFTLNLINLSYSKKSLFFTVISLMWCR